MENYLLLLLLIVVSKQLLMDYNDGLNGLESNNATATNGPTILITAPPTYVEKHIKNKQTNNNNNILYQQPTRHCLERYYPSESTA
jgi:hypothetical protein